MFANVKNCYHSSQAFGINLFTSKFESNLSFLICKLVCSLCAQLCQISDSSRARNWHSKGRGRWFVLWRTILHSEIRGPSGSIRRRKRSHHSENGWSLSGRPSYFVGFMVSPKGIDKFVNLPFCLFVFTYWFILLKTCLCPQRATVSLALQGLTNHIHSLQIL